MSSDAAARRREARVRKILGNMNDRLNKIAGSDSQFVCNEPSTTQTFVKRPESKVEEVCSFEQKGPEIVRELLAKPGLPNPQDNANFVQKLAANHLLHVAVVAVVTYVLLRTHSAFLIYEVKIEIRL